MLEIKPTFTIIENEVDVTNKYTRSERHSARLSAFKQASGKVVGFVAIHAGDMLQRAMDDCIGTQGREEYRRMVGLPSLHPEVVQPVEEKIVYVRVPQARNSQGQFAAS